VDEWILVRGFALRNPVTQEATAVKPWSFTLKTYNQIGANQCVSVVHRILRIMYILLILSNICLGERLVFVMKQLPYVTSPNVTERAELCPFNMLSFRTASRNGNR
jgi:hypothetical protein